MYLEYNNTLWILLTIEPISSSYDCSYIHPSNSQQVILFFMFNISLFYSKDAEPVYHSLPNDTTCN